MLMNVRKVSGKVFQLLPRITLPNLIDRNYKVDRCQIKFHAILLFFNFHRKSHNLMQQTSNDKNQLSSILLPL